MNRMAKSVFFGILAILAVSSTGASFAGSDSDALEGEHDLTGVWRMVPSKVDAPRRYRDGDTTLADGTRVPRVPGSGMWFLPRLFRIGTSDNGLALSDSTGTILQVVMFMPVKEGDGERMPPRFAGTWKDDRLVVLRPGRPGTKLTQTFWLDGANTLVVKTKMHREHGSDFEVKRTYARTPPS
jgi:hypothetical protein